MIRNFLVLVCLFFVHSADLSFAQSTPTEQLGIVPGGSYQSYKVDTVNIANGNAFIHIPLASLPQKGRLALSYSVNLNTTSWQASYYCIEEYIRCDYFYYTYSGPSQPLSGGSLDGAHFGPSVVQDQGYSLPYYAGTQLPKPPGGESDGTCGDSG